jgi:Protein of unknown function (DUF2927)
MLPMFRADCPRISPCVSPRARTLCLSFLALTSAALLGCADPGAQVTMNTPEALGFSASSAARPGSPVSVPVSESAMASDFLDLAFQMESGRALPVLSRFEGPIRVAVRGNMPQGAASDLARLIQRLRTEAGIDIAMASGGAAAQITVEFQPRATLRRIAPTAACFVVPGASSLAEYRRNRGSAAMDWGSVQTRTRAAIFVPSDTSPQEVRDCLHEELAQAIGPLNDLYRLPDSVFNDDNFHTVLTSFDMAILRAYTAPELRSGMTRDQVASVLPGVLARTGTVPSASSRSPSPRGWLEAIQGAVAGGSGVPARRTDAARALAVAEDQGWNDARTAFSHFAVARLEVTRDPGLAAQHFDMAEAIWAGLPGTEIHLAHIDLQRASMALAMGNADTAIARANRAMPAVTRSGNAALEATALLIKAEALNLIGRTDEADRLRLDSRVLQRYGFGSGSDVEARVHEIATLNTRISSN